MMLRCVRFVRLVIRLEGLGVLSVIKHPNV